MANITKIAPGVRVLAESPRAGLRLQVKRHNGRLALCIADETGVFELGTLIDDKSTNLLADFVTVALNEFGEALVERIHINGDRT